MLQRVKERTQVTRPEDVAEIIRALLKAESKTDREKEHWWVIGLNTRNTIKYVDLVALGILDSCICHPRETFRLAILKGVSSIILAHNHPSGDPEPSPDDRELTNRITNAGEIIGIKVLDHVIVGNGSQMSVSLKDRGTVR